MGIMGDNEVYGSILGNTTINADDLEALTLVYNVDQYLSIKEEQETLGETYTPLDHGITQEEVSQATGYKDRLKYFYPYGVYDNFASNDPRKTKVTLATLKFWELSYQNSRNAYT